MHGAVQQSNNVDTVATNPLFQDKFIGISLSIYLAELAKTTGRDDENVVAQ
jgi:hypothetical protein